MLNWVCTIEHVTPASKGGENSPENYAASCNSCNNNRGDLDWEIFMVNTLHVIVVVLVLML